MRARIALVGLALIGLSLIALVAAGVLIRGLAAPPDYGRPPRLAAVIDGGKMEEFLETPSEKEALLSWVAAGAPERDWAAVERVLDERCTTCHFTGASFEVLPLDNYTDVRGAAKVLPTLREKITGGTMGEYLETPDAHSAMLAWIDGGAQESEWPRAKAVLDAHCVHCHNPEGVQGIVALQSYRAVSRLATLPPAAPRPLVAPGAALIVALVGLGGVIGYRRRGQSSRT